MKPIAFFHSSFVGLFSTFIQNKTTSVIKTVRDNEKTLTIKIRFVSEKENINYENTFNVEGWSKAQKSALIRRISNSLGVRTRRSA